MQFSTGVRSCRGGALFKLLVFLVVLFGVVAAAWIFFLPMLLTSTLSKKTGFDVKVERLTMNPFSSSVDVEGLVVSNPFTFPRPDYVDVRSFQARAPLRTLWSDRPEFDYVRIDVSRMTFVRNTDGTVNATLFYDRLVPPEKTLMSEEKPKPTDKTAKKVEPKTAPAPVPEKKKMAFLIRRLELKIDTVIADDRYGRTPYTKTFPVGIDQYYVNVTDAKQLFTPAMVRSIAPAATAIAALIPGDLGQVLAVASGGAGSREPVKRPADPMKSIVDTLEESRKP